MAEPTGWKRRAFLLAVRSPSHVGGKAFRIWHRWDIADVFYFIGMPAFAVGRTVIMGSIQTGSLCKLITDKRENLCLIA